MIKASKLFKVVTLTIISASTMSTAHSLANHTNGVYVEAYDNKGNEYASYMDSNKVEKYAYDNHCGGVVYINGRYTELNY